MLDSLTDNLENCMETSTFFFLFLVCPKNKRCPQTLFFFFSKWKWAYLPGLLIMSSKWDTLNNAFTFNYTSCLWWRNGHSKEHAVVGVDLWHQTSQIILIIYFKSWNWKALHFAIDSTWAPSNDGFLSYFLFTSSRIVSWEIWCMDKIDGR